MSDEGALPDVAPLLAEPAPTWRAFAGRLAEIGFDGAYVSSTMRVGERLDDPLRAPMRVWKARRRPEPAAIPLRLFVLGDAVPADAARAALGERITDAMTAMGVLVGDRSEVRSPFRVDVAFERAILSDDLAAAGDAVMGPAVTTAYLARAARPSRRVGALLDLGCGAGTLALALAPFADRVVATDLNPRALAFVQVNARMNGVAGVETREGAGFAPIAADTFDLVVSQPPFVARPRSAAPAPFLYGGSRGDELALDLLAATPARLSPRGRALFLYDATTTEAPALPGGDVALLQSPARNLEDHCTLLAATSHDALDASFARAAVAWRDHFEAVGVEALRLTLAVVERAPASRKPWSAVVPTRHFVDAPPTPAAVDHTMRVRSLLAEGSSVLLDAVVRLPAERMLPPFVLQPDATKVVRALAEGRNVRETIGAVARDPAASLEHVRDALLRGVLEPVTA